MEAAAAGVLTGLLAGGGDGGGPLGESKQTSFVPWVSLSPGVRSFINGAVRQELSGLKVNVAEYQEVLVAFQHLPDKQAELSRKQAELSNKQAELSQKQAELYEQQAELSRQQRDSHEGQQASSEQPSTQLSSVACKSQVHEFRAEAQAALAAEYQCCLAGCNTLQAEVAALQEVVLKWSQMVAAHKVTAVMYVLEKHQLLTDVLSRLQD